MKKTWYLEILSILIYNFIYIYISFNLLIFLIYLFYYLSHNFFSGDNEIAADRDRESMSPDLLSDTPPVPPRRRDRKRHTPPRPISNGLPPTPKVHMGACFSKVSLQKAYWLTYIYIIFWFIIILFVIYFNIWKCFFYCIISQQIKVLFIILFLLQILIGI